MTKAKAAHKPWIDRTVTLGLIVTLIIETASALTWAGAAEVRIRTVETQLSSTAEISERLARMEEQMTMVRTSLDRIEQRLNVYKDREMTSR